MFVVIWIIHWLLQSAYIWLCDLLLGCMLFRGVAIRVYRLYCLLQFLVQVRSGIWYSLLGNLNSCMEVEVSFIYYLWVEVVGLLFCEVLVLCV